MNKGDKDHRRPRHAGSYSPVRLDTTQIFCRSHHWTFEWQKRVGGNEPWNKKEAEWFVAEHFGHGATVSAQWVLMEKRTDNISETKKK